MKTDELIRAIAADAGAPAPSLAGRFGLLLGLSVLSAAFAFWMLLGPRADLLTSLDQARFSFKLVVTLLLTGAAAGLAMRQLRPGAAAGWWRLAVLSAPALLTLGATAELLWLPSAHWGDVMVGQNARVCLTYIPIMGAAPLCLLLLAFRRGAPAHPARAGAMAGLLAGGIAATFYATHCPDDSPLFVIVWYSIAVAMLAIIGALLGSRVLRW